MKFKPNGDRVLVQQDAPVTETEQGIVMPNASAIEKPVGVVVAVGPAAKAFKVGTRVFFTSYTGVRVEIDESEYLLFKADDLLGSIDGTD